MGTFGNYLERFCSLNGIFVRKKGFIDKQAEGAAYTPSVVLPGKTSADHPAPNNELHLRACGTFEV
jgi:hypothetical protein